MPAMTPLSTRLNRVSKKSRANNRANPKTPYKRPHQPSGQTRLLKARLNVRIELRPSRVHQVIHLSVIALAVLAPINVQLPSAVIGLAWAWALGSAIHGYCHPQRFTELRDEGETWLLVSPACADRVRFKNTDYRSAYLIIIAFTTRTGVIRRVCIWRDAVTYPAFSWICARTTLGSPDRSVKIVATSSQRCFFHPPRG